MKQRILHILMSAMLLVNLAFTQVVVGYLHTHDHAHDTSGITIEEAEDGCFACSLHIVQELFHVEIDSLYFTSTVHPEYFFERIQSVSFASICPSGRAPPAVL